MNKRFRVEEAKIANGYPPVLVICDDKTPIRRIFIDPNQKFNSDKLKDLLSWVFEWAELND